ncbi:MAG TPA: COX15/CtaA family protein [Ktedonobacterales bacterium]|nr:COX15/CtaA family protein [Ktedonobacterales bacterium]
MGQNRLQPGIVATRERTARLLTRVYTPRFTRRLATVTAAGMFVVYVLGTLVTTTGSGHGCGNSWPLCRGKFIPSFAITTAIEFTHRIATSIITVLVLALALGLLWLWRSRLEIRILAPLMVVALFAEAGLGAALVLARESALLLAVHFGASLILFTSILLAAILVNELDRWDGMRDRPLPGGFRWLVFGMAAYTYVVGYLGAYMRLRGDELACDSWPLCGRGQAIPGLSGAQGTNFTHRLAALLLLLGAVWLFAWARRMRRARPDLYRGTLWALALVLAQAAAGAIVVFTRVAEVSQMLHAGLVALLFGALCYLALHTIPRPAAVRASQRIVTQRQVASEGAPATATTAGAPAAAAPGQGA